MKTLRRDELFLLAIELSLPNLIHFCGTSKQINASICKNDNFWLYKLNKDFPEWNNSALEDVKDPRSLKSITQMKSYRNKYILLDNLRIFQILKEKLKINADIYEIFKIERLTLYEKELKEIPKEIKYLIHLKSLDLENNPIKIIPKEICNLINLKSLNLNQTEITEIPKEIGNLINLTYLSLEGNDITRLPQEMEKLSHLYYLDISHNPISLENVRKLQKSLPKLEIRNDK